MAGKTTNIARMAEKLSEELFSTFGWKDTGSTNQNWSCQNSSHGSKTHPSDVVFFYDEPYSDIRTYLNCDLKSYKKGSITSASVRAAIESLAKAVSCAEVSEEWQRKYCHKNVTPAICGLLFIYNHDGAYDADFNTMLKEIAPSKLALPRGSKLIVLGPQDIFWLDNVRHDIVLCRGSNTLPPTEQCQFLYPDLVRRKLIIAKPRTAATVEMLTSPWIMLESRDKENHRIGLDIYYRDQGNTTDEFLYLIDCLLHYNLVQSNVGIRIKTLNADSNASTRFEQAKSTYVDNYGRMIGARPGHQQKAAELEERLKKINCRSIKQVVANFSEIELGMRERLSDSKRARQTRRFSMS